ncbi:hypothetical protein FHX80_12675 [Streptomyces brevispora]|uniref:Uncharacterized protein n=1 Tax=Streptomyces brevispora TaxID=887462 RepID=A0A561TZ12_9ACTN|nr:hypothetical protein [Streptomyces brevispora]TWF92355.1 hypothetical protein FHX80_12675 [Streptomyces brevispora]
MAQNHARRTTDRSRPAKPRASRWTVLRGLLESVAQFGDKATKTVRGVLRTCQDAESAYRCARDIVTAVSGLWRDFFNPAEATGHA